VDIGIASPQYEQLTVTYHLSGSTCSSLTACPVSCQRSSAALSLGLPSSRNRYWEPQPKFGILSASDRPLWLFPRCLVGRTWAQPKGDCAHLLAARFRKMKGVGPDHSALG
jgi:hypothetical protein